MKRLLAVLLCGIISLSFIGCNRQEEYVLYEEIPLESHEASMYLANASANIAHGYINFSTTWVDIDGLNGMVIISDKVYWDVIDELSTPERELHTMLVKTKNNIVVYVENDGVVSVDYTGSNILVPSHRWYNLSEGKVVAE